MSLKGMKGHEVFNIDFVEIFVESSFSSFLKTRKTKTRRNDYFGAKFESGKKLVSLLLNKLFWIAERLINLCPSLI